jgi:hypothetical protein
VADTHESGVQKPDRVMLSLLSLPSLFTLLSQFTCTTTTVYKAPNLVDARFVVIVIVISKLGRRLLWPSW